MASELAPSGEVAVLNALTGTVFVALHTSAATTNPPTNEVPTASTGYARQQVTAWTTSGSNPTQTKNTNIVSFTPAGPTSWGTINQFSLWSAVTGGNMLGWGDLTTAKAVNNGDTARFAALSLSITAN